MRIFTTLLIAFLTLASLPTNADAQPNQLSKEDAAKGWLLLFDGKTSYGWTTQGDVKVKDGVLILAAEKKQAKAKKGKKGKKQKGKKGKGKKSKSYPAYMPAVATHNTKFHQFELSVEWYNNQPRGGLYVGNSKGQPVFSTLIGETDAPKKEWVKTHLVCKFSPKKKAYVLTLKIPYGSKKKQVDSYTETLSVANPPLSIILKGDGPSPLKIRNLKLKPIGGKSIFNGKNLQGWKVYPGKKSKYTVTEEGWLNVKNGGGDIQTVGKYKDFILQLQCISNGKHLNSGIFFRAVPGEYWRGYEAQIRNQSTPGESRAYKLQQYDPKTHKPTKSMIVKSEAVDYGTGGLYRRMPARKVVSEDKEWFTMTVVAHGNHLATWVNGFPVAEYTDNRPLNDNPRTGCCLNAGCISIQGHDPTTDLSFRNLNVFPYPKTSK